MHVNFAINVSKGSGEQPRNNSLLVGISAIDLCRDVKALLLSRKGVVLLKYIR